MLKRCNNEKHEQYPNYGGRGIRVCDRWRTFENFYADMGDAPDGHTIDRVNNNGDYEPSNCRWSTQKTQIRNKRNTAFIEYEGKQVPLAQVCETLGLPLKRTRNRIYAGWSVSDALQHKRRSKWHRGT
jgi:ribosomal protein S16